MLVVLPILAFISLWLVVGNHAPSDGWPRAAIRAAILWGVFAVASAEVLGLLSGITPLGLSLSWLAVLATAGFILRRRSRGGNPILWPRAAVPRGWLNRILLAGTLIIVFVTGALGVVTPPQSNDSLGYHMARVAHWAQDGSLRHFATGIEVQNSMSPGGEILALHTYVLSRGDWLVNAVQWAAMVLSLVAAWAITHQIGGDETAGMIAVAFVASLPMGIAESSNTMMDYVGAIWVAAAASECIGLFRRGAAGGWKSGFLYVSLAAGLAFLTKPSAVPFLVPFGLATAYFLARRAPFRQSLAYGGLGLAAMALINAGYLGRNMRTYGEPFTDALVSHHRNELLTPAGLVSNVLRNAALHAGTPWRGLNELIFRGVVGVHAKLGLDVNDPRTTGWGYFAVTTPSTHEAAAGNPAHAALSLVVFVMQLLRPRRFGLPSLMVGLAAVLGFLVFSAVFKWQIWGSRLQLPFFVLIGPFAGAVLSRALPAVPAQSIGILLIVLSRPWLLGIDTRPILPAASGTDVASVLAQPREDLYFPNVGWVREGYRGAASRITAAGCADVGFVLSGNAMEYILWALLGAPSEDLHVEWFVGGTPSAQYERAEFAPCAVVCERCPEGWTIIRGLPLAAEFGDVWLFMEE